jgi:hypothetical protein
MSMSSEEGMRMQEGRKWRGKEKKRIAAVI